MTKNVIYNIACCFIFVVFGCFCSRHYINAATNLGANCPYSGGILLLAESFSYKFYNYSGQNNINGIEAVAAFGNLDIYINGTLVLSDYSGGYATFRPIQGKGANFLEFTIEYKLHAGGSFNMNFIPGNTLDYLGFNYSWFTDSYYVSGGVKYTVNFSGYKGLPYFKTYYDDGFEPSIDYENFGLYNIAKQYTCTIGTTCSTVFKGIASSSINVWLNEYPNCNFFNEENALATATNIFNDKYLIFPNATTTGIYQYTIATFNNDLSVAQCDNITVTWIDQEIPTFEEESLVNVCESVSTSTGSLWDNIRYGFECGARKILYWSFYPKKESIGLLNNNINNLKNDFPFSAFFQIENIIDDSFSTTTLKSSSFSVPFIRKTSTSTEYYMLNVISSSSMENAIGKENSEMFRNTFIYMIWISVFFIIFLRLL